MSGSWTYNGVRCYRIGEQPYAYQTAHVEIDADGSPDAYGPHDTGLDYSKNAGYPDRDWSSCLVADPRNASAPYVQPDGDFAGYFVSMTSLEDPTKAKTDIACYVPATTIPYIVLPGSFYRSVGTGQLGDFVMAKNLLTGKTSGAIIADIGPSHAQLGEISIALAIALGGNNPNPRNGAGAPTGVNRYVVFPYSHLRPAWPLTTAEIETHAEALLASIGGWDAVDTLFGG